MPSAMIEFVRGVVHVTVALVAFNTGMNAAPSHLAEILGRPWLLVRSLVGVLIVVPVFALLWLELFSPGPAMVAGTLAAALSIGPVAALAKSSKHGSSQSFALGLNLVLLSTSIVFVPLAAWAVAAAFGRDFQLSPAVVVRVILPMQLLPLVLGWVVGRLSPALVERTSRYVTLGTNLVLAALVVLVVVVFFKPLLGIGLRGFVVAAALAASAVLGGHVLGGPDAGERRVLAAFMAMRFPALALALAKLTAQGQRAIPAVVVYVICGVIAQALYVAVSSRTVRHPPQHPDSQPLSVNSG